MSCNIVVHTWTVLDSHHVHKIDLRNVNLPVTWNCDMPLGCADPQIYSYDYNNRIYITMTMTMTMTIKIFYLT